MGKDFKRRLTPVVLIVFALIFLLGMFFWFRGRMNKELNSATERYLTENVKALATVFYTKLDDQVVMLESQTRYFKEVDLADYNLMKKTIMGTKGIGGFKTIGVASSAGSTMNYNGMSSGNIMMTDYFKDAMAGNNAISATTMLDEEQDDILAVAVPIVQDDEEAPVGIIYGTFTRDELNSLVDTVRFADNGANLLLTEEGNILARTQDTPLVEDGVVNIYDMIPGVELPKDEQMNYHVYDSGYQKNIIVLTPIGVHGWCFATIVPDSIVSRQSRKISNYVIVVIVGTTIMFLGLLVILWNMIRKNIIMQRKTERYSTVTNQSKDVIIDYDYHRESLTVEGNVLLVMHEIKPEYNKADMANLLERIHEDDNSMYKQLVEVEKSDTRSVTGECRILGNDEEYHWFNVNITILRDNNNRPVRTIGNLINVDEQVSKEHTLKKKAETDALTDIMNKLAFQEHTEAEMGGLSDDEKLIFFIIDLDNFKAINDNLGHVMGDKVLTDVASKLKGIFADNGAVGRIGGDEFAAYIKPDEAVTDVKKLIDDVGTKVCSSVKADYTSDGKTVGISSSVGVAVFPKDAKEYKELYGKADEALYISKNNGKNRYTIYS